jgi:hypothetical protein
MRKYLQLASRSIERILDQTSDKRLPQYVLHSSFPYFLGARFKETVSDPRRGQK